MGKDARAERNGHGHETDGHGRTRAHKNVTMHIPNFYIQKNILGYIYISWALFEPRLFLGKLLKISLVSLFFICSKYFQQAKGRSDRF